MFPRSLESKNKISKNYLKLFRLNKEIYKALQEKSQDRKKL